MIVWLIFLIYTELYSVGITLLAKRAGMRRYGLNMIPFYAYFTADKLSGGYRILGVSVGSFGKTVIKLAAVCLCVYLYGLWGIGHLTDKNIVPLIQILWVPAGFCILVFWLNIVFSSMKILFVFRSSFKAEAWVCALLVTVPVLFILVAKNGTVPEASLPEVKPE